MKRAMQLCVTVLLLCLLPMGAFAAEIPADGTYEFTGAEFSADGAAPDGLLVREVPDCAVCLLCMGERVIRAGDVLAASDLERLTLRPVRDENGSASILYCPIVGGSLGAQQTLTMMIRSTKNEAPVAEDLTLETYKNIANEGVLRAADPEGEPLSYRIEDRPKRGTVELGENGSFVYTPKKNKVGEDRFTYRATDLAGNSSNLATVTIRITQPLDAETFDDLPPSGQFAAMWMRECGLFGGERVTDRLCFCPDAPVSRGEFLAMTMELAGIEPEIGLQAEVFTDQQTAPAWVRPYLTSAMRRGIARGYRTEDGLEFRPNNAITAVEAAAILTRTLHLKQSLPAAALDDGIPEWAEGSVSALTCAGIALPGAPELALTRADAANLLYAAAAFAQEAA